MAKPKSVELKSYLALHTIHTDRGDFVIIDDLTKALIGSADSEGRFSKQTRLGGVGGSIESVRYINNDTERSTILSFSEFDKLGRPYHLKEKARYTAQEMPVKVTNNA